MGSEEDWMSSLRSCWEGRRLWGSCVIDVYIVRLECPVLGAPSSAVLSLSVFVPLFRDRSYHVHVQGREHQQDLERTLALFHRLTQGLSKTLECKKGSEG